MKNLGYLIFDMDGTLFNSMPTHAKAFSDILQDEFQIDTSLSQEIYLNTAGEPLNEQFILVGKTSNIKIKNVGKLIDNFWIKIIKEKPIVFKDTLEVIPKLFNASYTLIVSSGCSPKVVKSKLKKSQINQFFDLVLGSDYESNCLKGEQHFNYIKNHYYLDDTEFSNSCIFIGDGKHDVTISEKASIKSIIRIRNQNYSRAKDFGADFLINSFYELNNLLKDQNHYIKISRLKFSK